LHSLPESEKANECAKFLVENNRSINKSEVGEILGGGEDKPPHPFFTREGYEQLRREYLDRKLELQPFEDKTFDEALRWYLQEGGFRLPPEGQKIERLLETFASTYVATHVGSFKNSDTAWRVAVSLLMLNSDLHNENLQKKQET